VQVAVTARHDAAGEVEGFLFVATDVTDERKQAKMKDEFVNLISHELRTPLSSILGYTELIADDEDHPLSAEQARYLATVERNAQRLMRLVSDLLFTAQVESGRFSLQEQRLDLQSIVGASMETARPAADARSVRLVLSHSDDPLEVWGDPLRLGQAVDNLISNALKFTPKGGRVAVTLGTAEGRDGAGDRALIAVSDTGIGIPADEIDRLFSRFFRASTATQNAIPGVGLGLTITQAIAVAHHGGIRVASTVGEGTTFTFELPLLEDTPDIVADDDGRAATVAGEPETAASADQPQVAATGRP
jgi:signal transduction histidine kinase